MDYTLQTTNHNRARLLRFNSSSSTSWSSAVVLGTHSVPSPFAIWESVIEAGCRDGGKRVNDSALTEPTMKKRVDKLYAKK
jgi:hypothetical protein